MTAFDIGELAKEAVIAGEPVFGEANPNAEDWEAFLTRWIEKAKSDDERMVQLFVAVDMGGVGVTAWRGTSNVGWTISQSTPPVKEPREITLARRVMKHPILFLLGLERDEFPSGLTHFFNAVVAHFEISAQNPDKAQRETALEAMALPRKFEYLDENSMYHYNMKNNFYGSLPNEPWERLYFYLDAVKKDYGFFSTDELYGKYFPLATDRTMPNDILIREKLAAIELIAPSEGTSYDPNHEFVGLVQSLRKLWRKHDLDVLEDVVSGMVDEDRDNLILASWKLNTRGLERAPLHVTQRMRDEAVQEIESILNR